MYLLNRDNLGGYDQGPGGGDNVVQRLGPSAACSGGPGVWPGDGGYVYIPTAGGQDGGGMFDVYQYGLSGSGTPSLAAASQRASPDVFGLGSGSPVITSDGTTPGSALVWIIWAANRQGNGGQLRAYDPVPVNGQPVFARARRSATRPTTARPAWAPAGSTSGTRDGKVLAFGSPVTHRSADRRHFPEDDDRHEQLEDADAHGQPQP